MGEKQEKVWVVTRMHLTRPYSVPSPVKVFDDRKDARRYANHYNSRAKKYRYRIVAANKG